jgi:Flp pilus assembly protein TadG
MIKHNQEGTVNSLLLPLILAVVFFIAALGFGGWAFSSRQDYKDNSDQKAAVAAASAKATEAENKDKQYAEEAKSPYKTYTGPEQYGTISLTYPKTWSGYVSTGSQSASPLNGYFNPNVVPSVTDQNSTFALRIEVVNSAYNDVLRNFNTQNGAVSISPYALPKVPKVVGAKATGQIENQKQGTMIVLPVRDKTLKIYTESTAFQSDFDNIILPNLTFVP